MKKKITYTNIQILPQNLFPHKAIESIGFEKTHEKLPQTDLSKEMWVLKGLKHLKTVLVDCLLEV